jgi:hypothetical protein
MAFKGDLEQYLLGADLSFAIEQNRKLAEQGIVTPERADSMNNWLIKVVALMELTGQPFSVIAASVPSEWNGFISGADGGTDANVPKAFRIGDDGIELEF